MSSAAAKSDGPQAFKVPTEVDPQARAVPLSQNAFTAAEFSTVPYVATIPHGTTLADVTDPSFWAHVAVKLHPYDTIRCVWDDFSMVADLIVIKPTKVSAVVGVMNTADLRSGSADIDLGAELGQYVIRFAGPGIGYRVIRKVDNAVLKDSGLPTEAAARDWLIAHLSDGSRAAPGADRGADKSKKAA